MKKYTTLFNLLCCLAMLAFCICKTDAQSSANINQAILMETGQKTEEVSTEELKRILEDKSATVFDARPFKEYSVGHIPGALNVSAKPNVPISLYISDVAEIKRLLQDNKTTPIVL